VRSQLLLISAIGAALVMPAVAIHAGGFLAYLATVCAFVAAWLQVVRHERQAIARVLRAERPRPAEPLTPEVSAGD
jgi:hypothetical protein